MGLAWFTYQVGLKNAARVASAACFDHERDGQGQLYPGDRR
jgi:hypothetical protein